LGEDFSPSKRSASLLRRSVPRPTPGRNSARAALATELTAVVLADLTGININTAVAWSRQVKRDWTDLVAARASK
jgi:hypothetical protein